MVENDNKTVDFDRLGGLGPKLSKTMPKTVDFGSLGQIAFKMRPYGGVWFCLL